MILKGKIIDLTFVFRISVFMFVIVFGFVFVFLILGLAGHEGWGPWRPDGASLGLKKNLFNKRAGSGYRKTRHIAIPTKKTVNGDQGEPPKDSLTVKLVFSLKHKDNE